MLMLVERYDCVLLDLDGTLYLGHEPADGAADAVRRLRAMNVPIVFMTNNSSRTPQEVAAHLTSLGFEARVEEVVTSALATGRLLAGRPGATAFVVGGRGLREAVAQSGRTLVGEDAEHADHVVVGWDTEVTYARLRTAAVLVQRGAALIGSNPDRAFPAPDGTLWPGAGALLAVVVATTGVEPEVVGKPAAPLFEAARAAGGGGTPLVVGDRLDTDIAGAAALGWDSMLVLTGVTTAEHLTQAGPRPTFVSADLGGLFEHEPPV